MKKREVDPVLRYVAIAYTLLYMRNLPRASTDEIPHLRPLEKKLEELLGDTDWYPSVTPDGAGVWFIYDDGSDELGTCARLLVDVQRRTVKYA